MASVNRIDSIYDVAAITAEQQEVEKAVRATIEQIKAARSQSIDFNVNTKSIADYNKNVAELNASMQKVQQSTANLTAATKVHAQATQQANGTLEQSIELRRRLQGSLNSYLKDQKEDITLLKSGVLNRAEYNKRLTESQAKVAVYKQKIQELDRVVKEDIAIEGRAGDAYKQLSAEYNRAALAAKNYQITLGNSNPITQQAVAKAKGLSDQLKNVDAAVGENGRKVGSYTEGITGAFKKMFGYLRTAANIIPGAGISGILLGIGTAIAYAVSALGIFNTKLSDTQRESKLLKDITDESTESIAKESTQLQVLKASIESTSTPMATRLQGIKDLREQYPDYFKDLTDEQILNGQVANAYDFATAAIYRKAMASAATSRIEQNAAKELKIRQKDLADVEETNAKLADKRGNQTVDEFGRVLDVTKQTNTLLKGGFVYRQNLRKQELADIKKDNDFLLKIAVAGAKETIKIDKVKETKDKKGAKGRDIAEANRKAQFEILKAQIELDKEFDLIRANDEKKSFVDRLTNLIIYGEDSQRLIEEQAKFDLATAGKTSLERQKIETDKNNALIRLSQELNDKLKKITQDSFETGTNKLPIDSKIPKELQKILDDFSKAQKKAIEDAAANAKKLKEAFKEAFESLATELEGLFFDVFTNAIERQKNAVQDQIDLLEKQKQKDIEVANQTITNASDRADAISVIEARAAAKKQQLELRQRQLDQQKARFEKARAVTEIIQSTAIAVTKALPNIALAAIIGAIGAIQIARVLAQPIPRYAEGTENHPGGPAIVGDGSKSETVVLPDGSLYRTPSKDTLVDMPKGSKVIPDYAGRPQNLAMIKPIDNTDKLMAGFASVVCAVKRIPQPIIKADRAWVQAHKTGSSYRNYLNRSI